MTTPAPKPIRVLLWSPKGSGLHYGGPGMTAYRLYAAAGPDRFRLVLAHGHPSQEQYPLFAQQHLIAKSSMGALDQLRFVMVARRWVARHAGEFDVFHGLQGFAMTVEPALVAEKRDLPAVIKLAAHRSDLADKPGWRSRLGFSRRRRQKVQRLSAIIAISRAIVDELREYGIPESKIAWIPNGVDIEQFRPVADAAERRALREQLGWRDLPTLLFAGGINRRKSPHLLVEAIGLLKQRGLECQLVLAGPENDPPYTAQINDIRRNMGIDALVHWQGFTTDMAPLYRAADVFALPSLNEGMPNALMEAMASGLPSIATPISGTTDLIDDDVHGRLVPRDAALIADALAAYVSDPQVAARHGQASRQKVVDRFSTAAVLDAHERLFRRIMAGGPAAE
ncbi:MAG: glycosyltransferase family 4 protein [Phycisphaeraceae bacterium]